ncbi:MAG: PLD nuclease N-terminal domain-containing protein [Candidatus Nanopelagicales bacterium]
MGRFLLVLAVITLYIYVLIDISRTPASEARILPKWLWAVVILLVFIAGPVLWLVLGRPRAQRPPSGGDGGGGSSGRRPGPRGPVAPDDDPDFLKKLDEQSWATRMERLRREREGGGGASPDSDGPAASSGPPSSGPAATPRPGADESDHSGA